MPQGPARAPPCRHFVSQARLRCTECLSRMLQGPNKRSLRVVYCKFHQTPTTAATYCHKLQTQQKKTHCVLVVYSTLGAVYKCVIER
eukprot:scaffold50585_cov69-Phaeocystis_antarctica.AAC.1